MRKIIRKFLFLILFLTSFFSFSSLAEAGYGPYLSFDIGTSSRRIEETGGMVIGKAFGTADSTRLLARLGMDLNVFDVYAMLGGASLTIDEFDSYHGKVAPAFGGGVNLSVYESPTREHFRLYLNPEVIYFKTNDTIQLFSLSRGTITENHEISWTEYGVKIGGTARYDMWEPYGGVKLSFVSASENGAFFGTGDIKERDNFGLFIGTHFYLDPDGRTSLYGEIGGGDTDYFQIGLKARF